MGGGGKLNVNTITVNGGGQTEPFEMTLSYMYTIGDYNDYYC